MKRTILHDAVIRGNLQLVEDILVSDKVLNNVSYTAILFLFPPPPQKKLLFARDSNKWTPLLFAASHGYIDIAIVLARARPSFLP